MITTTTFEAHGHKWQVHTPGDPMPCGGNAEVYVLLRRDDLKLTWHNYEAAGNWDWTRFDCTDKWYEIKGWRYAAPPQEKDELARLREENAKMRTAIKDGHTALEKVYLAYCSTTLTTDETAPTEQR